MGVEAYVVMELLEWISQWIPGRERAGEVMVKMRTHSRDRG